MVADIEAMLNPCAEQINVPAGATHVIASPNSPVIPAKAGIPYAAAHRFNHRRLWNTGSPAFAGDDD